MARALSVARSRAALAALLFALASAAYAPMLGHAWLNYDDDHLVTRNAELQRGLSWENLGWAFATQQGANWVPLTRLSWMLDLELHGLDAGGFLLTNLVLHALASALLFVALSQLTGELPRSAFVAAVFAVHPVHVESVAWISERRDVLAGVFCMLTLLAYAWTARERTPQTARERAPRTARFAVFASLALGLLAKPVLVTLPCVLLLLDAWPLGRLARGARNPDPGRLAQAALAKLPLFALAALASFATWRAQAESNVVVSLERLALVDRLANALVAYAVYLRQCFWPSGLAVIHPHPGSGLAPWQPLLAAALLAGVTAFALRQWPRRGWLAVGWFWFVGMLVPTIGVVQVGSQAHADRYLYLPLIGIAIAVAWSVPAGRDARRRAALAAAAALILASLFVATRLELRHWRDSVSLFERALAVTGDNAIAHAQLGAAYEAQGRLAETIRHYREAVRIRPDFRTATNNLAWLLATSRDAALRDPAAAVELAERAAALGPEPDAAVLDTLAAAYASAGRFDEAVAAGERAVRASETSETPAQTQALRERLALYRARRAYQE